MKVNPIEVANKLECIQRELDQGNTEVAKEKLSKLHSKFDITDGGNDTIGITIRTHTYEYTEHSYLLTTEYESIVDALEIVVDYTTRALSPASDKSSRVIANEITDLKQSVSESTYNSISPDREIHLDVDAYYLRIIVQYKRVSSRTPRTPTSQDIINVAEKLVQDVETGEITPPEK